MKIRLQRQKKDQSLRTRTEIKRESESKFEKTGKKRTETLFDPEMSAMTLDDGRPVHSQSVFVS
jgi:hypothetical protein